MERSEDLGIIKVERQVERASGRLVCPQLKQVQVDLQLFVSWICLLYYSWPDGGDILLPASEEEFLSSCG